MNVAIDIDGTITANPNFFSRFSKLPGIQVFILTGRPSESKNETIELYITTSSVNNEREVLKQTLFL